MSKEKLKQVLEEVDIAEEAFHNGFAQGVRSAEDDLRKEIELRIKANNHESLDEAAWNYASKNCEYDAFKAGAEWMKKQLLP